MSFQAEGLDAQEAGKHADAILRIPRGKELGALDDG